MVPGESSEGSGKTRSSLPCYLFSILCICRLREVKLAKRSVTSSTCREIARLIRGPHTGHGTWALPLFRAYNCFLLMVFQ